MRTLPEATDCGGPGVVTAARKAEGGLRRHLEDTGVCKSEGPVLSRRGRPRGVAS